jgi:RimJ/RimL family protein N-acetyltransferase
MTMIKSLSDFPLISTARLRITPLLDGDVSAFQRLTDDPSITDVVEFLPTPFTELDALQLLRTQDKNNCFLGAWLGKELVGTVGIHLRKQDRLEIGYWVGTSFQGLGYAQEATSTVIAELTQAYDGLEIIAECRLENEASWNLLQKLGFRSTGTRGHRPGRELLKLVGISPRKRFDAP